MRRKIAVLGNAEILCACSTSGMKVTLHMNEVLDLSKKKKNCLITFTVPVRVLACLHCARTHTHTHHVCIFLRVSLSDYKRSWSSAVWPFPSEECSCESSSRRHANFPIRMQERGSGREGVAITGVQLGLVDSGFVILIRTLSLIFLKTFCQARVFLPLNVEKQIIGCLHTLDGLHYVFI